MDWLIAFDAAHPILIYAVAFIGMYIEGDFMLLLLGALARGRYVSYFGMLLVAFVATILHDIIFWKIGNWLSRKKRTKYLYFDLTKLITFLDRMKKWSGAYIVFSKFAWNFNRFILVGLGYVGVPFKKILTYSPISAVIWPILYMSIGFVFADQTDIFRQRIERVGMFIAGMVVLVIVFELFIRKIVIKNFFNGNQNNNKDRE
ncbi:hypothetical protein A2755_03300 [Candidatus Wolfebacteria bacterium RIFCSPHIGHO2_01_FULL_48_22]|uniref:DedA family protein n=2 Tax=Candidatus Wolfeibacteriota TaxID=1752735 RepID=A0A1F8DRV9_9BACT|nr:MAG: hypothetical protein A2755_03300 [Candidatus Wolfebacteria bacterium RIFCSPHIGHO2_01_FULL_48_22]OGM92055.1 MAG: hypothetical protein A2935_01790 [Candidatus Wolfebacteria bacterium RIFCSPLOWO2_01_FULL_47_17b]